MWIYNTFVMTSINLDIVFIYALNVRSTKFNTLGKYITSDWPTNKEDIVKDNLHKYIRWTYDHQSSMHLTYLSQNTTIWFRKVYRFSSKCVKYVYIRTCCVRITLVVKRNGSKCNNPCEKRSRTYICSLTFQQPEKLLKNPKNNSWTSRAWVHEPL